MLMTFQRQRKNKKTLQHQLTFIAQAEIHSGRHPLKKRSKMNVSSVSQDEWPKRFILTVEIQVIQVKIQIISKYKIQEEAVPIEERKKNVSNIPKTIEQRKLLTIQNLSHLLYLKINLIKKNHLINKKKACFILT